MRIRQSTMKQFMNCALTYRWGVLEGAPREQSASLTFGSLMHLAIEQVDREALSKRVVDADKIVDWFTRAWNDPATVDPGLVPSHFVKGTTHEGFLRDGEKIIRSWAELLVWDPDEVLYRERHFVVPLAGSPHELEGTLDRLAVRYHAPTASQVLVVQDWKTNKKMPTYSYLEADLQFTMYCYAVKQREFWDTDEDYDRVKDMDVHAEWLHLRGPRRIDAGIRTEVDFMRLRYAVNEIAAAIGMRVFPPTISGETCRYCDFRQACGLKPLTT